jgi:hypothetical protein
MVEPNLAALLTLRELPMFTHVTTERRYALPSAHRPKMLAALPVRMKFRRLRPLPRCVKNPTDIEEPNLAVLRKLREELMDISPKREQIDPTFMLPSFMIEKPLPTRKYCLIEREEPISHIAKTEHRAEVRRCERTLRELPKCTNISADVWLPNLSQLRRLRDDANMKASTQESARTEPKTFRLCTEKQLPNRANPLNEIADPHWKKS